MSFWDSLERFANDVDRFFKGKPKVVANLKSCKACNFHRKVSGELYCTQTSPPTRILSEYYAQGCIYYATEEITTGLISKAEREAGYGSLIDRIKKVDLVDLITKISEITTVKTLETLSEITNIKNIESLDLVDLITEITTIQTIDTINAVKIIEPNIGCVTEKASMTLNGGQTSTVIYLEGKGSVSVIMLRLICTQGALLKSQIRLKITIDGGTEYVEHLDNLLLVTGNVVNTPTPITFSEIDDADFKYNIAFCFKMPFISTFRFRIQNTADAGNILGIFGLYAYEKTS